MKPLRWLGWLGVLALAAAVLAQEPSEVTPLEDEPPVVVITLTDGTRVEGTLRTNDAQTVSIEVAFAGGTILQPQTIARTNIVTMVPLDAAQMQERAMERAWQNIQRYQLNPTTSYSAEYYRRVLDVVMRPFLEKYPHSPHAAAVAEQLMRWQDEHRKVADGQAKYRGQWMGAEEARRLIAKQQGEELLRQARAHLQRGQYELAIERLRNVASPEARQLTKEAYGKWLSALEAEQLRLHENIAVAEQKLADATNTKNELESRRPSQSTGDTKWLGTSPQDLQALNQARSDMATLSSQLQQSKARLESVERVIAKIGPPAGRVGVKREAKSEPTSGTVVDEPVQDVQSPIVAREDAGNPTFLRQIAAFFRDYWLGILVVVVLFVWLVTRKLSQ